MNLRRILFLLVIALAITLSGCGSDRVRTQPLTTVWGRGLSVGTANLRESAAITVDPEGEKTHLIWAQKGDYGTDIHYALIDRESGIEVSKDLLSGLFLPRSYRLFVTPQGQIHLLTKAKSNKDAISGVYHLQISQNGELIGKPALITPPDQIIESYDAIMLSDDQVALFWESGQEAQGGIDYRLVDLKRKTGGDVLKIDTTGRGPSAILDDSGVLHLTWYQIDSNRGVRDIHYTDYPNAEVVADDDIVLMNHGHSQSATYSQPVISYDDGHIYIFWYSEIVSGLEAGTGKTIYVSFPKGQPQHTHKADIQIPDMAVEIAPADPNQIAYADVSSEMVAVSSSYVLYPAPISSAAAELPLLLSARISYRMQEVMQPVMAVLIDGVQVGYAPVARTDYLSYFPAGARDGRENAFSVWLDYRGSGRYPVFLSSTSQDWKTGILKANSKDVAGDVMREMAFGLLAVVALTPMIFLVFFLPFTWIIILLLLGRAQDLNTRGGRIQFGVAIVLFYVTKIAAFGPMLSSPSLLRTVSPPLAGILLFALPALIFFIAAIAFIVYVRRADPPGLPTGFLIFVVIDLFLTVLMYGPTLYS